MKRHVIITCLNAWQKYLLQKDRSPTLTIQEQGSGAQRV